MKYGSLIFLLAVLMVGIKCSNNSVLKATPEELAIEYFSDSVVQNASGFQDTSAIMLHDWPEFDSMWISKGFLYKEKLFASNLVTGISEPYLTKSSLLTESERTMDSNDLKRAKEFVRDFESKEKVSPADFTIRMPKRFSQITYKDFTLRNGEDEFFVFTRHHIKSSDELTVEIYLIDHHGVTHSFLIFLDLSARVTGWINRARLITDFTRDIYQNEYIPRK